MSLIGVFKTFLPLTPVFPPSHCLVQFDAGSMGMKSAVLRVSFSLSAKRFPKPRSPNCFVDPVVFLWFLQHFIGPYCCWMRLFYPISMMFRLALPICIRLLFPHWVPSPQSNFSVHHVRLLIHQASDHISISAFELLSSFATATRHLNTKWLALRCPRTVPEKLVHSCKIVCAILNLSRILIAFQILITSPG